MEENTDSMAARGEMSLRSVHVMQLLADPEKLTLPYLKQLPTVHEQKRESLSFRAYDCAACGFFRVDRLLLNMRRAHDVTGNVISWGPRNRQLMQLIDFLYGSDCKWLVTMLAFLPSLWSQSLPVISVSLAV